MRQCGVMVWGRFESQTWAGIPALPPQLYGLGQAINVSIHEFPLLENGDDNVPQPDTQ